MKKKGMVYRLTMLMGAGMIGAQIVGESSYSFFYKDQRNQEIKEEKKMTDLQDEEDSNPILKSREQYKNERLNKIKEMRYKEN